MLLKGTKTALQYWQIDGISYPVLSKEVIKVFSMVTSSASSEREFLSMAFIHSKLLDKVNKLIFIKNNAGQVFVRKIRIGNCQMTKTRRLLQLQERSVDWKISMKTVNKSVKTIHKWV